MTTDIINVTCDAAYLVRGMVVMQTGDGAVLVRLSEVSHWDERSGRTTLHLRSGAILICENAPDLPDRNAVNELNDLLWSTDWTKGN